MSKRVFSIVLALAVMLVALPILPTGLNADAYYNTAVYSDSQYDGSKYFKIVNTWSVNSFPAEGGNEGYYAGTDTGAATNPEYYGAASATISYSYDAAKGAGKYSYASSGEATADVRLKRLPTAGTNMISFHIDATNVAPKTEDVDYFEALVSIAYRNQNGRTQASNTLYYFLPDATEENPNPELITMKVNPSSNAWNQRTRFKAGMSGTYYIPATAFGPTTKAANGYDNPWPTGWQYLNDASLVNGQTWWMDANNGRYSVLSFSMLNLQENDVFYVDDLCFHEVRSEGNNQVFTINKQYPVNEFNAEASSLYAVAGSDTGAATTPKYYGAGSDSGTVAYEFAGNNGGKYSYSASGEGTASVRLKNLPTADTNMVAFHLDATDVAATSSDWFYGLISIAYRNQGTRTLQGGRYIYFQPDGSSEVEKIATTKSNGSYNTRVEFRAGVSGTYYIPAEYFEDTTADISGYTDSFDSATWETLTDLATGQTWWMDTGNYLYSNFAIGKLQLTEGDTLYIDELRYLNVTYAPLESNTEFVVKSEKNANTFSTFSKQNYTNYNYDKGVTAAPTTYGNGTIANGGMTFSGIASAYAYIKNFSDADTNMISMHIDLTDIQRDGGYFYARTGMAMYNNGHTQVKGAEYYFVPDATAEDPNPEVVVLSTSKSPANNSIYNVRTTFVAGKSGTYYFPEEMFGQPTAAGHDSDEGYNAKWTDFGCDFMTNTNGTGGNAWFLDSGNCSRAYFGITMLSLNEGESFTVDDIKWVNYKKIHTVNYYGYGDTLIDTEYVEDGNTLANVPTNPFRYGHVFTDWDSDVTTAVSGNMDITALFEKDTTIDYNVDLGASAPADTTIEFGGNYQAGEPINYNQRVTVTAPATKGEETFAYWELNGQKFSYDAKISFLTFGDLNLVPVYTAEPVEEAPVVFCDPEAGVIENAEGWDMHIHGVASAEGITEIGVLLTNVDTITTGADLKAAYEAGGETKVFKLASSKISANNQFDYTIYGIGTGQTRTAAVYAIVDGTMYVSSAVCTATVQ